MKDYNKEFDDMMLRFSFSEADLRQQLSRLKSALFWYKFGKYTLLKGVARVNQGFCLHFGDDVPRALYIFAPGKYERYRENNAFWFKPGNCTSRISTLRNCIKHLEEYLS